MNEQLYADLLAEVEGTTASPAQPAQQNPTTETPPSAPPADSIEAPPNVEAPQNPYQQSQATPPGQGVPISEEQAKVYAKMYAKTMSFFCSFTASFITGNDPGRYAFTPAQEKDLTDAGTEFFKQSGWKVTPGMYFLIVNITVVGAVAFKAYLDYKEKKTLEKREQQRIAKAQAEQAERQRREAEAERLRLAAMQQKQAQVETTPKPPEIVENIDMKSDIDRQTKSSEEKPKPAEPKQKNKVAAPDISAEDFVKLIEIKTDRICFELTPGGKYELKPDRGYIKKTDEHLRDAPSAFVLSLIQQAEADTAPDIEKRSAVINKKVRRVLDGLRKKFNVTPVTPKQPFI